MNTTTKGEMKMEQLKKEYKWHKEAFELQGIEYNDTFDEFVKWKEDVKKEKSDNIERHNWLYSANG